MTQEEAKKHRQRWALISECIEKGIWNDEDAMRDWLFVQFGTRRTSKLTDKQTRIFAVYLKFFAGKMSKRPTFDARLPWRMQPTQEWMIDEICKMLGWTTKDLNQFIYRQLGVYTFKSALSKNAASKVITGLQRVYNDQKKRI